MVSYNNRFIWVSYKKRSSLYWYTGEAAREIWNWPLLGSQQNAEEYPDFFMWQLGAPRLVEIWTRAAPRMFEDISFLSQHCVRWW